MATPNIRRIAATAVFLLALLFSSPAFANTCTWVTGSTKNWSDASAWTLCGSVAPTAADDVVVAGTGTLTVDGTSVSPSLGRDINFTGFTGTLTHGAAKELDVSGSFTMVSGATYAPSNTSVLKFTATTTGKTITTGGKTMGGVEWAGVGGEWTLQDAFSVASSNTVTLTAGSLVTNNQTVAAGLSSSGSGVRALTLGTTNWTIASNAGQSWDIGTSTNMTLSAASSTITFATTTISNSFNGGGLTYGTLTATALTSGTITINQSNTFGTVTLSEAASIAGSYRFQSGTTQTATGTWTGNGNSVINRLYYRATTVGSPATITAATFAFTNIDLQDITGVDSGGADSRNISAITGNSGNCGGNTGWTFTTPVDRYWVASAGTSTGSESATTRWSATDNGAGGATSPLCQDTAYINSHSIDAGSRTITQDKPRIGAHIWTGATNTPAWSTNTAMSLYGNLTMIAAMTHSNSGAITVMGQNGVTITTNGTGLVGSAGVAFTIDSGGGTVTQGDNWTSIGTLVGTSGTLAGAGTYTTSWTTATWNGGTLTESGNMTLTGALSVTGGTFGAGVGVVTGGTTSNFSGGTTNLKGFSGTTTTVAGGTVTLGSSGLAGSNLTVSSGTFTLNGASTGMTGSVTVSGGTWNLNADYTTSSNTFTHATSIGTIVLAASADLTIGTVLKLSGPTAGGAVINPGMYGGFN